MFTAFVLSIALANPVPPPAPVAAGPAPRLVELKADTNGKVMVSVVRTETQKIEVTQAGPNGVPVTTTREVQVPKVETVELAQVKDLQITTADGKKVAVADAVKRLKDGAVVAVSADGKPVAPRFLKALKDDVLVLVAHELTGGASLIQPAGPRPVPAVDTAPAVPPVAVKARPGQVSVAPPAPPK